MKKLIVMALSLCCLGSFNAFGAEITILTESYPPYEFIENDQWVGTDIDIVKEALKRLGHTPIIKDVPFKRALKIMEDGLNEAIMSLFKTDERANFMYYPDVNLNVEKNVIFVKKGSNIKINSLDDLKGKPLGVQSEYSYGTIFDEYQGLNKEYSRTDEMLIKKLHAGRTDLIIANELVALYTVQQQKLEPIDAIFVVSEGPLYIGFSKKHPNGKMLMEGFNKVLDEMKKEGVIDSIIKKYTSTINQ